MRRFCVLFLQLILLSFCSSELSVEKRDKLLNGFVDYLNSLPNQPYEYDEGILLNANSTDVNVYNIEVRLKVTELKDLDSFKYLKCTGTVQDLGDSGVTLPNNNYHCLEAPEADQDLEEVVTDNAEVEHRPVQLDNEVQPDNTVTSGEQFIAIPREQPAPCIGCASHVDPQAAGVTELANLGVKQLDRHEPNVKHSLNTVLDVERQVQVVNGVRYILTLTVDYDNCTLTDTEACSFQKTCKISILEKPWVKSPSGLKYRAIMANNCTEEWLFGDKGEVISDPSANKENNEINVNLTSDNNDKTDDSQKSTPDYDKIAKTGSADDILKVVHQQLQLQPNQEKIFTDEEMKILEEQIIPKNQIHELPRSNLESNKEESQPMNVNVEKVAKLENSNNIGDKSVPNTKQEENNNENNSGALTDDKKKALDDLMDFFNFAGLNSKNDDTDEPPRMKRSYSSDLQVMTLAEKFKKLKSNIEHSKSLYALGQTMVDYLNEMDLEVKTRTLKSILAAEEEFENHQHFFYIQALVTIPCDKAECESKDTEVKICNGIIDSSNQKSPQVLNSFCYNNEKKKLPLGKVSGVPLNDPILLKLTNKALKKIESEIPLPNAMRVKKTLSANTQRVSGTLTKISFVLEFTNCTKTVPIVLRENCTISEELGTKVCEVAIHERQWLNEQRITYTCTERPADASFVNAKQYGMKKVKVNDPKVLEIAQEALQYLEVQSNRNNKQKIVEVKSVSTQLVAGLLTNVEFIVGYTTCPSDFDETINKCELLANEPLRKCHAQAWERPWLEDGRQVNVTCDGLINNTDENAILQLRKKRNVNLEPKNITIDQKTRLNRYVGGQSDQDPSDSKYMTLAEESLNKYLKTSGETQHHKVIQVVKVTTQVVSGKLTRITFTVLPKNCQLDSDGKPSSENCVVQSCESEIWERPWLNSKEITVDCTFNKPRSKRQIPGGQSDQDPSDPKYVTLAEESLNKYLKTSGETQHHKVIQVVKVTTQVVSGKLTRITFTVLPTNCQLDSDGKPSSENCLVQSCESEIWERPWLNSKEITVDCTFNKPRSKRQIPGGQSDQDPSDPKYVTLAEESLNKYLKTSGETQHHKVIQVVKVTTQVVSGKLTRITFTILPRNCQLDSNGEPSSENCVVQSCESEIWERPWLNSKEITVDCTVNKPRAKRQIKGGQSDQDPTDPKFLTLAEESLNKYLKTSGETQHHKVIQVVKVTTQVVSGKLTRITFTILPTNCQLDSNGEPSSENCVVQICKSEIWERPWLNSKEITVDCTFNKSRAKRQLTGGQLDQDPTAPRFLTLAHESLNKYLKMSGETQHHNVIQVVKVTTQVVSGTLTRITFTILPTNCQLDSDGKPSSENCVVQSCESKVWERPWLNSKEITVDCAKSGRVTRKKRDTIVGGTTDVDTNDENAKELADESLKKYLFHSGDKRVHKLIEIEHVTKKIVSGVITRIDFKISPTNCQPDDLIEDPQISCDTDSSKIISCHSEVWERPWLKHGKLIDVNCEDLVENDLETMGDDVEINENANMEYFNVTNEFGFIIGQSVVHETGNQEQNASEPEYKIWAEKSLRKYERLQNSNVHREVIKVKQVSKQMVSAIKYTIDFTAAPNNCSINELNTKYCKRTFLNCHTVIRNRTWLKTEDIEVNCFNGYKEKENERENHEDTKHLGRAEEQDVTKEYYQTLAGKALQKYQTHINAVYLHKVTKIKRVTEQVVSGFLTRIDFIASPTNCLVTDGKSVDNCDFQDPKVTLRCFAEIYEAPRSTESIKVNCKIMKKKRTEKTGRNRRQLSPDEEYMDDETTYYYADRAMSSLNDRSHTENLFKVITIHDIQKSMHMNTIMVRMYLETAMTYCLRNEPDDLNKCDEIEGMNHKLCLARLWPSPDDELVVKQVSVVCDDNKDFESITGISVIDLLKMSIAKLEKSPDITYKIVHQGEPNYVPSLDSKKPIKLSFIIATTNCTKDIDIERYGSQCFINPQRPVKACRSFVWFKPNSRTVMNVNVECGMPKADRTKRSISLDSANATVDDLVIQKMVQESLDKLEMSSLHRYKQRVLLINSYNTKITTGRETTIDFDVGYTTCLKYEWVENVTSCEFLEHLPRRHCVSQVWERLWVDNGRRIEVTCEDDETPLEAHIEFESAENAMHLAREALKHIEAKYPHPRKQKVVRIFSLEKQMVAGLHYRIKIEVGLTDCMALSIEDNCKLVSDLGLNKFCRVNIWLRPWTDHPPNYRVTCDYQDSATSEVYHNIQAEQLFHHFLMIHKPEYLNNNEEMKRRFAIFKKNIQKIHQLNIYERGTARYAVTKFTDLSAEEFSLKYLGLRPELRNENQVPMRNADIPKIEIPEKFDWRGFDAVTEVKDQGSCGSCWAFSVTGNIEGQWKMQSGQLVSLSEQELVDCDKLDQGCNGGLPDNAYRAIEQMGGLEAENDYPYAGEDDTCSYNKSLSRVQISGAVNITSNETDMAKWLVQNGPISIGINANAMQFYVGGVSHPWKMLCDPKNLDHGVLIIGYGVKDYPLFHKRLPYWIVKNSWGPSWGEQGYYRVYRGDGTCGVNLMASSAVI